MRHDRNLIFCPDCFLFEFFSVVSLVIAVHKHVVQTLVFNFGMILVNLTLLMRQ